MSDCSFRIGQGYDVHALGDGLPLRLGGVDVAYERGCIAHSDGDVVVHALCDALLGSVGQGDIGLHFPDNSDEYKGIDSMILLERTVEIVCRSGFRVVNVDVTIVAQSPKMRPYIDAMRRRLAEVLRVAVECVSVKATTTEHLGFEGRGEGIASMAVALVERL